MSGVASIYHEAIVAVLASRDFVVSRDGVVA